MFNKVQLTALVLAFHSFTNAHVEIETPVPYGAGDAAPALDTNPLKADGSDFPCKQRPEVYKLVKQNMMAIGQPQTLSFRGQATHGGGSCQISLSTDKEPTKDSVWKVILSIEGGCPSKNPGNVGNDPFGYGADKFQYQIPPEIAPGDYTLAFTWFNKIGNREMYMNCAPITVTGSGKRDLDGFDESDNSTMAETNDGLFKRDMSSLPDMFVANIGNGCTTAQSGTDLAFPPENLGKIVQRIDTGPLTPPIGNCVKKSSGSTAPQAQPQPAGNARPIPSAPISTTSAPAVQPTVVQPTVVQPTVPTTQSQPAAQPTIPAAKSIPVPQVQPQSQPQPQPASAPFELPHISGTSIGSCPTPGKSLCSDDGLGFGTCDQYNQVLFQPLPLGTKCDKQLGVLVPARRKRCSM